MVLKYAGAVRGAVGMQKYFWLKTNLRMGVVKTRGGGKGGIKLIPVKYRYKQ